jgi:hypothetical protein
MLAANAWSALPLKGVAVLIKSADNKQPDIDALTALLARSDVDAATRRKIEQDIRSIRAGADGERERPGRSFEANRTRRWIQPNSRT